MRTAARDAVVTLALAGVGAVLGALAGVLSLVLSLVIGGHVRWLAGSPGPGILLVPAIVGAVCGAVLAPALAWVFLRRVPLWRVLLYPPLGAIAGGALTDLLGGGRDPITGAAVGTVLATVLLALTARRRGRVATGAGAGRDDA